MKKTLIALAVLAAAGAASAQSSVTLFGIVDATYAHGSGSLSNKTQLTNSGYNSSRLGFRGNEDMGGGAQAGFWLEAGLTNDDGTGAGTSSTNQTVANFDAVKGTGAAVRSGTQGLTFNRRSTVSIGGSWGELRLGRDYTPQFWTLTVYDPFGTNGVGTTQTLNSTVGGPTAVRASNSITYLYGHAFNSTYVGGAGFHAAVQYYMGENNSGAANSNDGNGYGIRVGYGAGPMTVAFATSKTSYTTGNTATGSPVGDVRMSNIGADYNFGVATVQGHYSSDKQGGINGKGWLLGALVPVGVGQVRLAYSTYKNDSGATPKTNKYALGYVHNVSKRTALYATYAHVSNSGGADAALNGAKTSANGSSNGYDLGLRHAF